jgi:hypothetical protein
LAQRLGPRIQVDRITGQTGKLEFDPAYGQEYAQLYNQNVAKLAWEVAQLLKTLQAEGSASKSDDRNVLSEPQAPSKPAVYLAECSYDRKQARELVEGELRRLGYPVLPDKRLPGAGRRSAKRNSSSN